MGAMSDPAPMTRDPDNGLRPAALALWLLVQLASLALSAARVRLAAGWPRPGVESLAVEQLLVVQVIAAALSFPALCAGWRQTLAAALAALPALMLASILESSD